MAIGNPNAMGCTIIAPNGVDMPPAVDPKAVLALSTIIEGLKPIAQRL
jgi:hypothetical protein